MPRMATVPTLTRLIGRGHIYARLRSIRNRTNKLLLGLSGAHPTSYVHISSRVANDVTIEEYGFVGFECQIAPGVHIGRYSMLAPRVAIVGADHVTNSPGIPMQFAGRPAQPQTVIERDVWVGHSAVLMRGITIGEGAIIAAGAVVTKSVPRYEVWAGVPAHRIADRFDEPDKSAHSDKVNGDLIYPQFAAAQVISG